MGRVRRHGYVIEWYIGDHEPRHVHVFNAKGEFLGRVNLATMQSLEGWAPSSKLLELVAELRKEGKL